MLPFFIIIFILKVFSQYKKKKNKKKLVVLTCAKQLHKWYRRFKVGFIPMVLLNDIKTNSATMNVNISKISIKTVESGGMYFNRDVGNLKSKLEQEKIVEQHMHFIFFQLERKKSVAQRLSH